MRNPVGRWPVAKSRFTKQVGQIIGSGPLSGVRQAAFQTTLSVHQTKGFGWPQSVHGPSPKGTSVPYFMRSILAATPRCPVGAAPGHRVGDLEVRYWVIRTTPAEAPMVLPVDLHEPVVVGW